MAYFVIQRAELAELNGRGGSYSYDRSTPGWSLFDCEQRILSMKRFSLIISGA
jgi:hypothetical protein